MKSRGEHLKYYKCDSTEDSSCLNNPESLEIENCEISLSTTSPKDYRCGTVKGVNEDEKIAIRECVQEDACKYELSDDKTFILGGILYQNSTCEVCTDTLCNKD
uniref:Uncharacterized protein n=1 Tax=Phlebotomus papatasi TaxID=29031 RepID=A0A1B0D068_PHLPP